MNELSYKMSDLFSSVQKYQKTNTFSCQNPLVDGNIMIFPSKVVNLHHEI
jgi:hypothetical protein